MPLEKNKCGVIVGHCDCRCLHVLNGKQHFFILWQGNGKNGNGYKNEKNFYAGTLRKYFPVPVPHFY